MNLGGFLRAALAFAVPAQAGFAAPKRLLVPRKLQSRNAAALTGTQLSRFPAHSFSLKNTSVISQAAPGVSGPVPAVAVVASVGQAAGVVSVASEMQLAPAARPVAWSGAVSLSGNRPVYGISAARDTAPPIAGSRDLVEFANLGAGRARLAMASLARLAQNLGSGFDGADFSWASPSYRRSRYYGDDRSRFRSMRQAKKDVAVMVVAVDNAPRVYETLGTRGGAQAVARFRDAVQQVAFDHRAFLVRWNGENVVFSFPRREDAVNAALAVQVRRDEWNSGRRDLVRAKIGIAEGVALPGLSPGGRVIDYWGEVMHRVHRLASEADPQTVLLDARLAGGLDDSLITGRSRLSAREVHAKGYELPIAAVELRPAIPENVGAKRRQEDPVKVRLQKRFLLTGDVIDSTFLSRTLPLSEYVAVFDFFDARFSHVVYDLGGMPFRWEGDGLTGIFSDALSAVQAALILRKVVQLPIRWALHYDEIASFASWQAGGLDYLGPGVDRALSLLGVSGQRELILSHAAMRKFSKNGRRWKRLFGWTPRRFWVERGGGLPQRALYRVGADKHLPDGSFQAQLDELERFIDSLRNNDRLRVDASFLAVD